jgi:hypothetical protein
VPSANLWRVIEQIDEDGEPRDQPAGRTLWHAKPSFLQELLQLDKVLIRKGSIVA